ncbi:hypothetical protein B7P43_G17226 [Cryptotermes secundus]|uniref:Uncharacterized protein n=1 Tax=Cryptotermes secundus TaxID=105785 RepID=A0A2J7RGF3_9NEOP|nr:hypothetical protein B7P43_G17226 [Cryptotermes secundus]
MHEPHANTEELIYTSDLLPEFLCAANNLCNRQKHSSHVQIKWLQNSPYSIHS